MLNTAKEAFSDVKFVNFAVTKSDNFYFSEILNAVKFASLSVEIPTVQEFIDFADLENADLIEYLRDLSQNGVCKRSCYQAEVVQQSLLKTASYSMSLDEKYDAVQLFKNGENGAYKASEEMNLSLNLYFSTQGIMQEKVRPEILILSPFPAVINSRNDIFRVQMVQQQQIIFLTQVSGIHLKITDFSSAQANSVSIQTEFLVEGNSQTNTIREDLMIFKEKDPQGYKNLIEKSKRGLKEMEELKKVKLQIKQLRDGVLFKYGVQQFIDSCNEEIQKLSLRQKEYFIKLRGQAIEQYNKRGGSGQ